MQINEFVRRQFTANLRSSEYHKAMNYCVACLRMFDSQSNAFPDKHSGILLVLS